MQTVRLLARLRSGAALACKVVVLQKGSNVVLSLMHQNVRQTGSGLVGVDGEVAGPARSCP